MARNDQFLPLAAQAARNIAKRRRSKGLDNEAASSRRPIMQAESLERRLLLTVAPASFLPQTTIAVGNIPLAVATADLNNDGKPDIIVANSGSNNIGVLINTGGGSFSPQQVYSTGKKPQSIAVGDLNGDGKLDVVVADFGSNQLSIFYGNGDGTLQQQKTLATGTFPSSVAVADLTGDGRLDIICTNFASTSVGVFINEGNGVFSPMVTYAVAATPTGLAVGDLNGDGKPDIVACNDGSGANSVSVLINNGNGTFVPQVTYAVGTGPDTVAIADINGDGKPDLIVGNNDAPGSNGSVSVLDGLGNGTFAPQVTYAAGRNPYQVVVADVNGDGKPDIAVVDSTNVDLLLNNGNGTFTSPQVISAGGVPESIAVADLQGDGEPDLIVGNYSSFNISLIDSDPNPYVLSINRTNPPGPSAPQGTVTFTVTFSKPVTAPKTTDFSFSTTGQVAVGAPISIAATSSSVYTVTVSDITGSGTLGLNIIPNSSITDTSGTPLRSANTFASPTTVAINNGPSIVRVADLTDNGIDDLVVATQTNAISVMLGNGDGTFQVPVTYATDGIPTDMELADLSGDGKLDIITADYASNMIEVLGGDGAGHFAAPVTYAAAGGPSGIAVADFNRDGKLDVAVTEKTANRIVVYLGVGAGVLGSPNTYATAMGPTGIATADFNGDGLPDLAVVDSITNGVSVFINSLGSFAPQVVLPTGMDPVSITLGNVFSDGHADMVIADKGDNTLTLYQGLGNGSFAPGVTLAVGAAPVDTAIGDITGAGYGDIVVAESGDNSIGLLANVGNGTFQGETTIATGSAYSSLQLADLTNDGLLDVVAVSPAASAATVLTSMSGAAGGYVGQTYTITKPGASISVTGQTVTFDGMSHAAEGVAVGASGENLSAGLHLSYALSGQSPSQTPPVEPGTYEVYASFDGTATYAPVSSYDTGQQIVINKADVTLKISGVLSPPDGNPHPASGTATGINGIDLSSMLTLSYQNTADNSISATAPSVLGTYQVLATFAGTSEYNALSNFPTGRYVIIANTSGLRPFLVGNLPVTSLVAGQKIAAIHQGLRVTNTTATDFTGVITVKVVISGDTVGGPSAPIVVTISKNVKIRAGRTISLGSAVVKSLPSSLVAGTYYFVAELTDPTGAVSNVPTLGAFTVVPPRTDLVALGVTTRAKAKPGKPLPITVLALQNGNVAITGNLPIALYLSTNSLIDSAAISLGTVNGRANIKPGRSASTHLTVTVPATVPAGHYFIVADIDPTNSLNDVDVLNNTIGTPAAITVT